MDQMMMMEEALIGASQMQRAAWREALMPDIEVKRLVAGQHVVLAGVEYVVQTARNYAALHHRDPDRIERMFMRHMDTGGPVWLVQLHHADAEHSYGGPIPPAEGLAPPIEHLWIGDTVEIGVHRGLIILAGDVPRLFFA